MSEEEGVLAGNLFRQVHTPEGLKSGHIRYESLDILNVAAGESKVETKSWPYPIGVSSGALLKVVNAEGGSESTDLGDFISVWVDIEHPSLALTQNATTGDSTVYIPQLLIEPLGMSQGDFLAIGNDDDNDVYLHIIEINRETGEITLKDELEDDLSIGTSLHMHRYFVGTPPANYRVIPGVVRTWGEDTFDSALLPANTPLRMKMVNNGSVAKSAYGELSILYGDD